MVSDELMEILDEAINLGRLLLHGTLPRAAPRIRLRSTSESGPVGASSTRAVPQGDRSRIESIDFARVRAICTSYPLHDRPAKLPGRTLEAFWVAGFPGRSFRVHDPCPRHPALDAGFFAITAAQEESSRCSIEDLGTGAFAGSVFRRHGRMILMSVATVATTPHTRAGHLLRTTKKHWRSAYWPFGDPQPTLFFASTLGFLVTESDTGDRIGAPMENPAGL